jgi:two-component system, sensor histidine kinase and response regulator
VSADPSLAHTPMVMLTSSAQQPEAERTHQAGIVAYLTKPVRSAQLRGALNIALSSAVPVDPNRSPVRSSALADDAPAFTNRAHREPVQLDRPHHATDSAIPAGGIVLVVEDNPVNQRVLTAMLAGLGYRTDVAANGFEALAAVGRNHYAAILMDCQMPVMDGYEATRKLREIEGPGRRTAVIAVTATAMATDRERCVAAGMDDYLVKPLSLRSLAAAMARWAPDTVIAPPALDDQIVERLERLGDDAGEDLMGQLSTLFEADADARVLVMRGALAGEDPATIASSAHTLSGASANVGASALAGLCATLEADSAAGDLTEAGAQIDALEAELGRVHLALSSRGTTR